jgi:hypothetical protein
VPVNREIVPVRYVSRGGQHTVNVGPATNVEFVTRSLSGNQAAVRIEQTRSK